MVRNYDSCCDYSDDAVIGATVDYDFGGDNFCSYGIYVCDFGGGGGGGDNFCFCVCCFGTYYDVA